MFFFDHLSNIFLTIHDIKDEKSASLLCYFVRGTEGTGGPEASQAQSVLSGQLGERYVTIQD